MHRIEYWRNKLNLTQSDLARKAEISPSYISKLEKHLKTPSLLMLFKIAEALGICPRDLLACNINCPRYKSSYKKCAAKKARKKKASD